MQKPIVIVDSGVGGVHILASCANKMPHQSFVYVADSFNAPYGTKRKAMLQKIAKDLVEDIQKFSPKLIVFACNTLTVNTIKKMRKSFPQICFVGTEPALKQAQIYGGDTIIFATPQTQKFFGKLKRKTKSQLKKEYRAQGLKYSSDDKIFQVSSPNLAKKIDENLWNLDVLLPQIKLLFDKPRFLECKNLVLGCTHYCAIKPQLEKCFLNIKMFDGVDAVAKRVSILAKPATRGKQTIKFISTDGNKNTEKKLKKYFNLIKK